MHFGTRAPQIICLCAGICNLVDGLRGLLRFRPRRRGCGVCIRRTLSLERDAPNQQETSQPKVLVGEQSADIEVVAAQIRLRGRDQASKKLPTSRVNSQVQTLNTLRPTVKCLSVCLSVSLSHCLPVCLSVCLSVTVTVSVSVSVSVSLSLSRSQCLSVSLPLSQCSSVSLTVCQVRPCICRSGLWCKVPARSLSPSDLSSQTLPLFTSLFAPPSLRCKRHG